ncbi:hypothetical protein BC830DRAFT_1141639 [Chytriomyces sp. MP71]|nr:hypothetical protein BC830DRAFT_1141639 [Chytriomyces sp. MP71]
MVCGSDWVASMAQWRVIVVKFFDPWVHSLSSCGSEKPSSLFASKRTMLSARCERFANGNLTSNSVLWLPPDSNAVRTASDGSDPLSHSSQPRDAATTVATMHRTAPRIRIRGGAWLKLLFLGISHLRFGTDPSCMRDWPQNHSISSPLLIAWVVV